VTGAITVLQMDAATAGDGQQASFSGFVALISDGRRGALSRLLAERTSLHSEALLFAANSDELKRAVTSGSLVLIEGSRLGELAASGRVREYPTASDAPQELGAAVDAWLSGLPARTRAAFHQALSDPRAWSVKRVAHAAGVSTRQLVRHCQHTQAGPSPKTVLLAARLVSAQAQVRSGRVRTSAELARACGWVDVRSLRAALRRAELESVSALILVSNGKATVSEMVSRITGSHT